MKKPEYINTHTTKADVKQIAIQHLHILSDKIRVWVADQVIELPIPSHGNITAGQIWATREKETIHGYQLPKSVAESDSSGESYPDHATDQFERS